MDENIAEMREKKIPNLAEKIIRFCRILALNSPYICINFSHLFDEFHRRKKKEERSYL